MKLRELGVVKKPVFVVPKSVVAQWGVEFSNYFPAAKLLVADDKSFTPANRKVFTNMIANGDYDAVIVTYEQFEKIPMSAEYQSRFYQEQIDEILRRALGDLADRVTIEHLITEDATVSPASTVRLTPWSTSRSPS